MRVERRKHIISQDRWMVSYADFITLLFALFVVLFAFAKADQKKQAQVTQSIDSAFKSLGVFSGANSASSQDHAAIPMNTVMEEDVLSPARVKEDLERLHRELKQILSGQISSHAIDWKSVG